MTDETTTTEKVGLSPADVKALRSADTVSFHSNAAHGSKIKAVKRAKGGDVWQGDELTRDIRVASEGTFYGTVAKECSECFVSAQYYQHWITIVGLLKAGDVLTLEWHKDSHTNGYCSNAIVQRNPDKPLESHGVGQSIHVDSLVLRVKRGDRKMHFLLCVSPCVDNTARMIRG